MWSSRFPCPEGVLSFTVNPTGAKHRVQSPLEGRPSAISTDWPEMESRPYELLLQCKGLIVICFPSLPFKCRSHYMKHFYTEISSFLFSSEKPGKTSQRKSHWAASVYTLLLTITLIRWSRLQNLTPTVLKLVAIHHLTLPRLFPESSFNQQCHKAFTCPHLIVQVFFLYSMFPIISGYSTSQGLPKWRSGEESACQRRRQKRCEFNPWVEKIP